MQQTFVFENYASLHKTHADTRISHIYDWIRNQTCLLSKSPPASFDCPPLRDKIHNDIISFSNTPLLVSFVLPIRGVARYGLVVESLDHDLGDGNMLLDIPPGSWSASGTRNYSLRVKLGGRYRIVLLNAAGHAIGDEGRMSVTWGDELLVEENASQGSLQVFSIERQFSIGNFDKNEHIATLLDYSRPSNSPTKMELSLSAKLPHPSNSFILPQTQNIPMIEKGTHTIDAEYLAANFGYTDGIVPRCLSITESVVVLASDVFIAPIESQNAITLNSGSYLFATGGRLVGGPSQSVPQSQPKHFGNEASDGAVGHGLMVIDTMHLMSRKNRPHSCYCLFLCLLFF